MNLKIPKKTLPVLITLIWAVAMFALIDRHYGVFSKEEAAALTIPEELYGEQWMGLYRKGEKVGYSMTRLEKLEGRYKASEMLYMKVNVMGVEKDIAMNTDIVLDNSLRLNSFDFTMKSDMDIKANAQRQGNILAVSLDIGGMKSEQKIPLGETPYMSMSVLPHMLQSGMAVGKKLKLPVVEPSTLVMDKMELEVIAKEPVAVMGIKRDAFKIKGSFKGAEMFMWVSEKGETLKEEAMGLAFIKEKKEDAMNIKSPSIDLIAEMSIPMGMRLPEDVNYLRVRLRGISFEGLELNGGAQKLTGDVLEVRKAGIDKIADYSFIEKDYLEDTLLVQSKDPEIVKLAHEIVKGEKDKLRASKLIYEWVYKNIAKVPAMTLPSAKEVLRTRRGDCNEHTTLYIALSRAAGIPARIAVGLMHKEGFFYYHAWPEVYLGQWFPVDPTVGQFPADATHIRLLTGGIDRQIRLTSVIGKLEIEGIEAR